MNGNFYLTWGCLPVKQACVRQKQGTIKEDPMSKRTLDTPLAKFLRVKRAERGISQHQAAEECGVHWRTWSIWETKDCRPSVDMCQLIAKWAKVETTDFIKQVILQEVESV